MANTRKPAISSAQKQKIKAGLELLCEENTSLDKIKKISKILEGTNPQLERKIKKILEIAENLEDIKGGEVIKLSAKNLPENTKKQKDKKKLLLLLIKNWGELKSEVERINALKTAADASGAASKTTAVKSGKILATMKGPLGIITIAAAGIVALSGFLNSKSVEVKVMNDGCGTIPPIRSNGLNLPGIKVPDEPLEEGLVHIYKIPAVSANIGLYKTADSYIELLGVQKQFNLPQKFSEISFDGKSLMGKSTKIDLSGKKSHDLVLKCAD